MAQPKGDGYRFIAYVDGDHRVRCWTRHGTSLSGRFRYLEEELARVMPAETVLDGELVALSPNGAGGPVQDFARLGATVLRRTPHAAREGEGRLHLMAFDVLQLGGEDLCWRPWMQRAERLSCVLADRCAHVSVVDEVPITGTAVERLVHLGFEGVVFKRRTSRYRPGERTSGWRKLKAHHNTTATLVAAQPDRGRRVVERVLVCTADGRLHSCAVWAPALAADFTDDPAGVRGLEVSVAYSRVDANGSLREARVEAILAAGACAELSEAVAG